MQFTLSLDIPPLTPAIKYTDQFLLIGSCFTEHMSDRLAQHKFKLCSNPHGILFNPLSVSMSLDRYVSGKEYGDDDLFYLNEVWNSWDHHTRFSDLSKAESLKSMNASLKEAAHAVRHARYIIITLGSAFQYYLKENNRPVSNNHRAPGQWFEKRLLETAYIQQQLQQTIQNIISVNKDVNFIFTISPVRHVRDGVVANNRSKARLLEAVHSLCDANKQVYYFPAYELVIDILRDYRFYDIDFVHPNYMATQFVWEQFVKACMSEETRNLMQRVLEITIAKRHRPRFPHTEAHRKFLEECSVKIERLVTEFPFLNLEEERSYFESSHH